MRSGALPNTVDRGLGHPPHNSLHSQPVIRNDVLLATNTGEPERCPAVCDLGSSWNGTLLTSISI